MPIVDLPRRPRTVGQLRAGVVAHGRRQDGSTFDRPARLETWRVDRLAIAMLSPAGVHRLTEHEVAAAIEALVAREQRQRALDNVATGELAEQVVAVLERDGRTDDARDLRAAIAAHQAELEQLRKARPPVAPIVAVSRAPSPRRGSPLNH